MSLEVTFIPSAAGSKSLGYGHVKVNGFSINFNVYRSPKSDAGIFVGLPSRKKFVDGKEVLKDGKPEYVSEVYIYDAEVRHALNEAVLNSMYNQGITLEPQIPETHTFNTNPSTPQQAPTISTNNTVLEDEELPF